MKKRLSVIGIMFLSVLLTVYLIGCGGGSGGGNASGSNNATITGTVSGTIVIAFDQNNTEVARNTASGNPKTFTLSVPVGGTYKFYLIENEGTTNERGYALYQGSTNLFNISSAVTINLGYVDTSSVVAIPANNPLSVAGVTSGGEDTTISPSLCSEFAICFAIADYFPLGQGDTWTYRKLEDEELFTQTISGTENINGVEAVKRIDEDGYELLTNNGITYYKEYDADDIEGCGWDQSIFTPPLTFSPAVVSIGAKYTFNSSQTYKNCTGFTVTATLSGGMTVEGIEDITVPAGTFKDCLKVKMIITSSESSRMERSQSKEFQNWLAKGVGIVKAIWTETNHSTGGVDVDNVELVTATVGGVKYPK